MKTNLSGTQIIPCRRVVNDRGFLQEVCRSDEEGFFQIGQAYLTQTKQGVIKAWYLHREQWDSFFTLQGNMKLGLCDDRPSSPTYRIVESHEFSSEEPHLIRIPPGVWHGFQAVGQDLLLLHMNSHPFQFHDTDEIRKDSYTSDIPFAW